MTLTTAIHIVLTETAKDQALSQNLTTFLGIREAYQNERRELQRLETRLLLRAETPATVGAWGARIDDTERMMRDAHDVLTLAIRERDPNPDPDHNDTHPYCGFCYELGMNPHLPNNYAALTCKNGKLVCDRCKADWSNTDLEPILESTIRPMLDTYETLRELWEEETQDDYVEILVAALGSNVSSGETTALAAAIKLYPDAPWPEFATKLVN